MSRTVTLYRAEDFERGTPPVLCTHCGEELMAIGSVAIHGMTAGYEWAHVSDGDVLCRVRSPKARPYDHYDAERALRATRRERADS